MLIPSIINHLGASSLPHLGALVTLPGFHSKGDDEKDITPTTLIVGDEIST